VQAWVSAHARDPPTGNDIWGPRAIRERRSCCCVGRSKLGINFFDTADSYGPHASESFIAETLYPLS